MKNNMLSKLKSGYEERETKPSAELWGRLSRKLDENPEVSQKAHSGWWKYAAAVVLLLISVGTVLYFNYQDRFTYRQTDYIVKKGLEKAVHRVNPELENPSVISNRELNREEKVKITISNSKSNPSEGIDSPVKNEVTRLYQVSEFKAPQIAVEQPENIQVRPVKIENIVPDFPAVVEAKKTKAVYISSNELLLGREFDKTTENLNKDIIKFGVFNFDRPKVENVTVLGVTVYMDSK